MIEVAMGVAIAIIGVVFGLLGLAGLVAPTRMALAINDGFKTSSVKIYGSAGIRALFGAILILGASDTAFPALIRFIGVVLILQAALVPVLGIDRVRSLLSWFLDRPTLLMRFLYLLVVLFGAFLVWAALQS